MYLTERVEYGIIITNILSEVKSMISDYSVLKSIIENGGREGYITDERFNVVWTNSQKPLTEILLCSEHSSLERARTKEAMISCSDGSALKITPIMVDGKAEAYVFERFTGNQILDMLSKTSVFYSFAEQYNSFRDSSLELLLKAAENDRFIAEKTDKLTAGSVNKSGSFKILSPESEPITMDLYVPLSYCCGSLQILANYTDLKLETEISMGLFTLTHLTSFEYVVLNLIINAYQNAEPGNRKLLVRGYRKDDNVIVEIHNNGDAPDIEKIEAFRHIYAVDRPEYSGEGLGIAMVQLFADKYNGEFLMSRSHLGGLCAELRLPYRLPDSRVSLFSPNYGENDDELMIELLKKCFTAKQLSVLQNR